MLTGRNILLIIVSIALSLSPSLYGQKGKDGAETYASGTVVLNRYTSLASSAASGSASFTVSNIIDLSGATAVTNGVNPYTANPLASGDLVMLYQVQGADITFTDDVNYGNITAYNNTGNYALVQVYSISSNTITICGTLPQSFTASSTARTQVIRVPRLTTLSIAAGTVVSGKTWDGTSGGVIALEANGNVTINGTISANGLGFRGGTDPSQTSTSAAGAGVISYYRSTLTTNSAGKGESIAGNVTDYAALGGANGRGAPANGGGGGNGHNAGGGGGSNAGIAGVLTGYNGTGVKPNQTTPTNWNAAWSLESANFHLNISPGGGRGGYTYSASNQDAITLGPGNSAWGGDERDNVGGFGGRPLDNNSNSRLFFGGGGGAGDANNSVGGTGGGAGGGLVYLLTNANISGSGTITSLGLAGGNTLPAHNDAPGGGGGGGTIVTMASGTITGISMNVSGGNGGNQLITTAEAEGAGGGGGAGLVLATTTSVTRTAGGGLYGTTSSTSLTEFTPNGTTGGASGTIASVTFSDVVSCSVLPVQFLDLNARKINDRVEISWAVAMEDGVSHYSIEESTDGLRFSAIARIAASGAPYHYTYSLFIGTSRGGEHWYRIKEFDQDGAYTLSKAVKIMIPAPGSSSSIYPNPVHHGEFKLSLMTDEPSQADIIIQTLTGRTVLVQKRTLTAGNNLLSVILPRGLSMGSYLLSVNGKNGSLHRQTFILR